MGGRKNPSDDRMLMIAAAIVVAMGLAWLVVAAPWSAADPSAIDEVDLAIESVAVRAVEPDTGIELGLASPASAAPQAESSPLHMAQMALEAGMLTEPAEYSAWTLYGQIADSDPDNAAAREGLEAVADALVARGRAALEQGRYADARNVTDIVTSRLPRHRAAITLRQAIVIAVTPPEPQPSVTPANAPDPGERIAELHAAFRDAMSGNAVLQPAGSSAVDIVDEMLALAPAHELTQADRSMLVTELLDRSAQSIEALDADAARTWIDSARPLAGDPGQIEQAETRLNRYLIETESQKIRPASELTLVSRVAPEFPRLALRREIEGWVEIEFVVSTTGATEDVTVIESSHESYFRDEAVAAVRQWRFEPVIFMDRSIPQRAVTRVEFLLD